MTKRAVLGPVDLSRALKLIGGMRSRLFESLNTEEIDSSLSAGRRLASDAIAQVSSPPYDTCTMDGYALSSSDQYPVKVVKRAFAGEGPTSLKAGEAAYVTTGARLPAGADAVMT